MLAETLHGLLREIFIAPRLGDLRARQLGVLIGMRADFRHRMGHGALDGRPLAPRAARGGRNLGAADADLRIRAGARHGPRLGPYSRGLQPGARRVHDAGHGLHVLRARACGKIAAHDHPSRRMSLRPRAFRSGCAGRAHGGRVQLLDVQPLRVPAPHRAGGPLPAHQGQGRADHVHLQHGHGEAPVLRHLRREILLRAAFASRWLQRERALHRFAHRDRHEDQLRRRPQLGGALPRRPRRVH